MMRQTIVRAASSAAIVLLAACAEAPTSALVQADDIPAALTEYPAPAPTISNSGGYPLISWTALAGATSYTVVYRTVHTVTTMTPYNLTVDIDEEPLVTTTATSYLDTAHAYTGSTICISGNTFPVSRKMYQYVVTATFPDGASHMTVFAPVSPC